MQADAPAVRSDPPADYLSHDVNVRASAHGVREIRRIVGPCHELAAQAEAAVEALGHAGLYGAQALIPTATTIAARATTLARLYDKHLLLTGSDDRKRYIEHAARLRAIASDLHGYIGKLIAALEVPA